MLTGFYVAFISQCLIFSYDAYHERPLRLKKIPLKRRYIY